MIGRALREDGAIRLWSCYTGARDEGASLVDDLRKATGRGVAMQRADWLECGRPLGGLWELRTGLNGSVPPLTESGVAAYQRLLLSHQDLERRIRDLGKGTPTAWTQRTGVPADGDDVFLAGTGGTIILDINTANLNSVAFNSTSNLMTLPIGVSFMLTVTGTSSSAITIGTTGTPGNYDRVAEIDQRLRRSRY